MPETPPSLSSRNSCPRIREGNYSTIILEHVFTKAINFRYGIFELEYPTNDGRIEAKILLILYAPDIAPAKEKFIYATSKDEVKKKLQPFNKEIQVNDWADLNDEQFIKYFKH